MEVFISISTNRVVDSLSYIQREKMPLISVIVGLTFRSAEFMQANNA